MLIIIIVISLYMNNAKEVAHFCVQLPETDSTFVDNMKLELVQLGHLKSKKKMSRILATFLHPQMLQSFRAEKIEKMILRRRILIFSSFFEKRLEGVAK